MLTYTSRRVVHTDGSQEAIPKPISSQSLPYKIGAAECACANLKHGMQMFWDGAGAEKKLPVNHLATAILFAAYPFGIEREIRGDVVIAPLADFEAVYG